MAYLDTYQTTLTAQTAAHLLRRATFGPTEQEIALFTGKTPTQAIDLLISNCALTASPPPPVEMGDGRADVGQPFLGKPLDTTRNYDYFLYVRFWWIGLMTQQNGAPSLLEKLTAFWQNHFVVAYNAAEDHRGIDKYLRLLRANALGNFRTLVTEITKDPGMLMYQNGNENEKLHPNENYGRELQELFTVGAKDFAGNDNYTEPDVKAVAQVLTGWQVQNYMTAGSTSISSVFTPGRHDTGNKTFSAKYNNTVITGRDGAGAGDAELGDLVTMLLAHPETPKFICRKLYRFYVNPNVTQEIEDQVIVPLAQFFASSGNNYAVQPVIKKLLSCEIFYDSRNIGAIIKSPAEHTIGIMRMFNLPVPNITTESIPFRKMTEFMEWRMAPMQMRFLNQLTVFGAPPYYQSGYSKNWINGTSLGLRAQTADNMAYPWLEVKPGYMLGPDFLAWIRALQPNFSNVSASPSVTADVVVEAFIKNMFAVPLSSDQKTFLIDKVMMRNHPRTSWVFELNAYRNAPNDVDKQNPILWRLRPLIQYTIKMAEFQLF